MRNHSITFIQAGMIMMLTTGLFNHVIVIPILLDAAKRDSWISVLYAGAILILWLALIYPIIVKTRGRNLFLLLKKSYPPIVSSFFVGVACIYLLAMCAITMRDTVMWIHVSFSPKAPLLILALGLAVLSILNAYLGIRSIAGTAGIFLPFVVLFGFFVMSSNFIHKDYSLLRPVFEYGVWPVWKGAMYVGTGLIEMTLLLFMQPYIRNKYSFFSLLILGLILVGLTFGPVTGAIAEFGPSEAEKLRYPAYEEWRLANIGRFVEHMDFLSVYQWFTGAFIRMSITAFLIVDILGVRGESKRLTVLTLLFTVVVIIAVIPYNDNLFLDLLTSYILPVMFWVMLVVSLLLVGLIHWAYRRMEAEK
jgi:spore germination protein KB